MQSSGPQSQLEHQHGTKGTTGPLNSTSGDTTYADSDGQVCFVCSNNSLVVAGVRGAVSLGPCLNLHYPRDQISCESRNTQSGGETFHAGPLGVWGRYSRQNQPRGLRRKFVRPTLSGVRGGASMGPLGCRRR